MSDRDREHHDVGHDPATARLQRGAELPSAEYTFDDEMPRLSPEDQRTVEALRPGTALLIAASTSTAARWVVLVMSLGLWQHLARHIIELR